MIYLDIRNVDVGRIAEQSQPLVPLPSALRAAGLMPNLDQLCIGDLILVSPFKPRPHHLAIFADQKDRYEEEHATWTHVAIYVGNGEVCEATVSGVVTSSFFELFPSNMVRVRRADFADDRTRFYLAIAGMRNLTKQYSWRDIIGFARSHVSRRVGRFRAKPGDQLYSGAFTCAGLYYEAFFIAAGEVPVNSHNRVCPADLSVSSKLFDVSLDWVRLPSKSGGSVEAEKPMVNNSAETMVDAVASK